MNRFLCLLLVCLLCPGCVVARYTKTRSAVPPDFLQAFLLGTNVPREKVTFSVYSFFANEKLTKLAIDKATSKTTTGVTLGSAETDIDDQAVESVVRGVVEGVVKGLK